MWEYHCERWCATQVERLLFEAPPAGRAPAGLSHGRIAARHETTAATGGKKTLAGVGLKGDRRQEMTLQLQSLLGSS